MTQNEEQYLEIRANIEGCRDSIAFFETRGQIHHANVERQKLNAYRAELSYLEASI